MSAPMKGDDVVGILRRALSVQPRDDVLVIRELVEDAAELIERQAAELAELRAANAILRDNLQRCCPEGVSLVEPERRAEPEDMEAIRVALNLLFDYVRGRATPNRLVDGDVYSAAHASFKRLVSEPRYTRAEALTMAAEWRDIETAPTSETDMLPVLLGLSDGRVTIGVFCTFAAMHGPAGGPPWDDEPDHPRWFEHFGPELSNDEQPTHWMPLPEPPRAEERSSR